MNKNHNYIQAFILSLLSFLIDLFVFKRELLQELAFYAEFHSALHGILRLTAHSIIAIFLATAFYGLIRSIPKIGKFLQWFFWFFINIVYKLSYFALDRLPNSQDLRNLLITPLEMSVETIFSVLSCKIISQAVFPVILVIVLYLFIKKICPFLQREKKYSFLKSAFSNVVAFFAVIVYVLNPMDISIVILDTFTNTMQLFIGYARELRYYGIQRLLHLPPPQFRTVDTIPQDNIVLIIDESIRGDYLSINNPSVDTTPILEKYIRLYPDNIWNYGLALSSGTYSFLSQAIMFSGVNKFPDKELKSLKNPTVFQIAKANQYKTFFIDLQGATPNTVMRNQDMNYVDELHVRWQEFSNDPKMADISVAKYLRNLLANEKGIFVVLCKWGAHVPYEMFYPRDEKQHQHYLPKLERLEQHSFSNRRKIVNSYKNALRFNVNGFFSALFEDDPTLMKNTTIIWVSDHGEMFQEHGVLIPHNAPYLESAIIPFVIFSSNSWVQENIKKPEEIYCTVSQQNIYPTLISIFEKRMNVKNGDFQSLLWQGEFQNKNLFFVDGALWNENVLTPSLKNGRIILDTENYMY